MANAPRILARLVLSVALLSTSFACSKARAQPVPPGEAESPQEIETEAEDADERDGSESEADGAGEAGATNSEGSETDGQAPDTASDASTGDEEAPDEEPLDESDAAEYEADFEDDGEFVADLDADDLGALSLDALLNVPVRTVSQLPQTAREAPGLVSVVTGDMARDYGYLTLNEILYREAGFQPSRDYDRRTVTSRGLFEGWNNNHLLLLIDGLPANDNLYGSAYTWETTPLFLMESVEIVRGPGSALYGSYATNGVLNLNTRPIPVEQVRAMGRVRLGTQGHQIYDAMASGSNENLGFLVGFNRFQTRGYEYLSADGSGRLDSSGDPARFRVNDARSSNYMFGKVEFYGDLRGLSLQVQYQQWDFGTGHGWLFSIPDLSESMNEWRTLTSVRYQRDFGNVHLFSALQFQHHAIDWNMRYFPNDSTAFGINYDQGLWEYLRTNADDMLAKVQLTIDLPKLASVVVGTEGRVFWYNGDQAHFSNVDLSNTFEPFPNGEDRSLGPWLEWIDGHPITNLAAYGQFASGELLGSHVAVTAGIRYDIVMVPFTRIYDPGRPDDDRRFQQVSPRLGLVVQPTEDLSIKLLGGRAFRAPTPTELAGANTFTLASNIDQLKPENVTTGELATEWRVLPELNVRLNGFLTRAENQIAYSTEGANLSNNLYTLTTTGLEGEVRFDVGPVDGFANYSYAHRLSESISDAGVSESSRLAWAPAHSFNFGARLRLGDLTAALNGHVQGRVRRRPNENATPTNVDARGRSVSPWLNLNLRVAYSVTEFMEVELIGNNLLNGLIGDRAALIKNFDYAFDYRLDGRRILVGLSLHI